jgi:hypothetical protein
LVGHELFIHSFQHKSQKASPVRGFCNEKAVDVETCVVDAPFLLVAFSSPQIEDFCSRFQPAYRAYLPQLYKEGPPGAKEEATLRIRIDESRNVHE